MQVKLSKINSDTGRINLLNTTSYKLALLNPDKAEGYRLQALQLAKRIRYRPAIAYSAYLEGVIFAQKEDYLTAIGAESKAIRLARQIDDFQLMARAYNAMGLCYGRIEDNNSALKAFKQAEKFIEKAEDQAFKSAILHNMAKVYVEKKQYAEGFIYFNQVVALTKKAGNKEWLAQNYLEMGKAFLKLKKYKKAEYLAVQSLALSTSVHYFRGEVQSRALLGALYVQLNKFSIAEKYLHEGLNRVKGQVKSEELLFYKEFANLFERQQNYYQAYQWGKKYSTLYDSLYNLDRNKLLAEYQQKFQNEQRDTENRLLRHEQELNRDRLRQKNTLLIIFCFVAVALVIFSVVVYWGNKKIRQNNRLLIQQNDEIIQQKENLEHVNHIKNKLFSVIAHDLRSPFAHMKSMIDFYEEGIMSKQDMDYFFKEIRKDLGSSSLLLDNLLIWAKSQLSGFKINPEPVHIQRIADEVIYMNKRKLESKGIRVENLLNAEDVAFANYEMVKAIVRNLLGNAIKFTPTGGLIQLKSKVLDDSSLEIAVIDSGIGITQERLGQLFQDAFFTTPGLNKEKGTGLGLQICKDFTEKNNGKLWVESDKGRGSTFYFTLPFCRLTQKEYEKVLLFRDEPEKNSFHEMIKANLKQQHKFDRYELLARVTNDTVWDWDMSNHEINWNDSLASNFGHQLETTDSAWLTDMVHPDERAMVKQSIDLAIHTRQENWEHEYRILCNDGTYKSVYNRGLILKDENTAGAVRMIGIIQNIQTQKNANREIQRLSLVAKNVNNLVVITDAGDNVVWVNKAFEKVTGYELKDVIGQQPKAFLTGPDTHPDVVREIEQYVSRKKSFSAELVNYTRWGTPYWVQIDCTPYDDPVSNQIGYVAIQTLITERKNYEQLILKKNEGLREVARISSHDVRNPLASILGLVNLLKSDLSERERTECMELLENSAVKLDLLIHHIHKHVKEIELEPALNEMAAEATGASDIFTTGGLRQ